MKGSLYGLTVLFLSIACTRSNPPGLPSPDILQPSAPGISSSSKSWTLTPDENLHSYASRASTTLELQQGTGIIRDSFTVTLDFSLRIQRSGDVPRITGTLDRLQRDGTAAPQTDPPVLTPLSFAGQVTSGGFALDSVDGRALATVADCENPGLNQMAVIRRSLVIVPPALKPGTSWTDSSTVSTCSGTIPVELTSIRTYTVTGEAQSSGGETILVERSERTRATGEGAQGQHRIGLQAAGTGTARLYLEPASGLLRLAEGESRTAVTIRSSGRLQQFIQTVKETTTRIR